MFSGLRQQWHTTFIFVFVLVLLGLGTAMVYSSSAVWDATNQNAHLLKQIDDDDLEEDLIFTSYHSRSTAMKQLLWVVLGLGVLFAFYSINYETVLRFRWPILIICMILLVLVLIPGIGSKINGARRWIKLGPINFQPSEFAKLAMVIFLAAWIGRLNKDRIKKFWRFYVPAVLFIGLFMAMIVLERDFGAMGVIFLVAMSMLFIGGVNRWHLVLSALCAAPVFVGLIIAKPYRVARVMAFLNPDADPQGAGWHLNQSLISVGSGGLYGKGLGLGMQKYRFLSESHNDFVFAMIGEELGFAGALATLLVFCLLISVAISVTCQADEPQGSILAGGIAAMLGIPALLHAGVVCGCLPPKGLAMPFVSYGGTSMLINMAAVGILMNVARGVDARVGERRVFTRKRRAARAEAAETTPAPKPKTKPKTKRGGKRGSGSTRRILDTPGASRGRRPATA